MSNALLDEDEELLQPDVGLATVKGMSDKNPRNCPKPLLPWLQEKM